MQCLTLICNPHLTTVILQYVRNPPLSVFLIYHMITVADYSLAINTKYAEVRYSPGL